MSNRKCDVALARSKAMVSLWLASQSPRRASMIKDAFPDAHCQGLVGVDETPVASGTVAEKVASICQVKADAIPSGHGYDIVLVCDTVLADPDEINALMGKPNDALHAATMLHRLSGRRHQVWSAAGVCVHGHWSFFTEYAVVEIDELPDEVLVDLVLNESWKGKAGGYDLAGPMGVHAKIIDGSTSTVLGIPQAAMDVLNSLA
jgi:septum formation protein